MRELTKKSKSGNDKTTTSGAKQSRRDLKKVPALDTVSDSQNRDPPSRRTPYKEGKGARSSVAKQKHRGLELASPVELPSPPMLLEGKSTRRKDNTKNITKYTELDKSSRGDGTRPGAFRIDGSQQDRLRPDGEISTDVSTIQLSATNNMVALQARWFRIQPLYRRSQWKACLMRNSLRQPWTQSL